MMRTEHGNDMLGVATVLATVVGIANCGGETGTTNSPPTADAGPDQTVVPFSTVTLSGSGADSDGTIQSYEWEQRSAIVA